MTPSDAGADEIERRRSEVWARLARVTDPELDERVTDLGFVTDVDIRDDAEVHVSFRLPTFWCAPNFAFMMGEDMRAAILGLDWVKAVTVTLGEHLFVDAINRGVNEGLPFKEAFGAEAFGNLDDLRRTFLNKAFCWRQEAVLTHFLKCGEPAQNLVLWTVDRLCRNLGKPEAAPLIDRYLERRDLAGPFDGASLAFVTTDGAPLPPAELGEYLKSIRRVRINAEFNGALCRRLLVERNSAEPLRPCGRERGSSFPGPAPFAP